MHSLKAPCTPGTGRFFCPKGRFLTFDLFLHIIKLYDYGLCRQVCNMKKQEQYGNSSISMLKCEDRVRKRPAVIFGSDDLEG